jgi:hypothetical protein
VLNQIKKPIEGNFFDFLYASFQFNGMRIVEAVCETVQNGIFLILTSADDKWKSKFFLVPKNKSKVLSFEEIME